MTDIALVASPTATPLAVWLASAEPQLQSSLYHGVLTPQELDAPAEETAALLRGAAVHDLGWLRRVQVRGEDRFRWLSGMVTNAVNELAGNSGAWNLVLNAQGRIQGDLTVWRGSLGGSTAAEETDSIEMELAADQAERLLAHFDRFIIMDDVELIAPEGETALGLTGPKAAEVLGRLGLPVLREPMTATQASWNGIELSIRRGYGALAEHYELWTPVTAVAKLWKFL